jgi:tetratricopeptide (TPR) repeat protein
MFKRSRSNDAVLVCAEQAIERARVLWNTGDLGAARRALALAESLAVVPEDRLAIANSWIDLGKPRRARKIASDLSNLIDLDCPFTNGIAPRDHELAHLWFRIGDATRTKVYLDHLRKRANCFDDWLHVAHLLAAAGRSREVADALLDASAHILTIEHRLQLADVTMRDGRTGEAFELLSQTERIANSPPDLIAVSKRWYLLNDLDAAERFLEEAWNRAWQYPHLLTCAEVWLARGDRETVLRCAADIEEKSKLFDEYLGICRLLTELVAPEPAERMFENADELATTTNDICALDIAGHDLDPTKVRNHSIADAERLAETVEDWFCCAKAWVHRGDHQQASRAVLRGEALSKTFEDRLAGVEANLALGNREGAERCLTQGEEAAFRYEDWYLCATAWGRAGSTEGIERCLGWAEREAGGSPTRLIETAEHWGRLTGAIHASTRIRSAIADFKYPSDWLAMSEQCWQSGQVAIATEMLRMAEANWETINDRYRCATLWRSFGDMRAARHCLERCEAGATAALDLATCGEAWRDYGDRDRALEVLERAEKAASTVADMVFVAGVWDYGFQQPKRCRRLIETATTSAEDTYDWTDCAESWHWLREQERAVSCAAKAESVASDADEWERCALLWDELGEEDRARVCQTTADGLDTSDA